MKKQILSQQTGYILAESLVALLVLSFGILGLAALEANMLNGSVASQLRLNATLMANELLSVADADKTNINCYTVPVANQQNCTNQFGNTYTTSWVNEITQRFPGAIQLPPTVTLANNVLTVTIQWRRPDENQTHNVVQIGQSNP